MKAKEAAEHVATMHANNNSSVPAEPQKRFKFP
jgi:hypothetical protein